MSPTSFIISNFVD